MSHEISTLRGPIAAELSATRKLSRSEVGADKRSALSRIRLQNIMTRRSKLVSVSMATLLFVLPLAGLPACLIPMPAMRSMTMDGSDMAVGMPPVSIQQGPPNASCCQLSVALTSRVSVVGPPEKWVKSGDSEKWGQTGRSRFL